jgi:hypothetical protein
MQRLRLVTDELEQPSERLRAIVLAPNLPLRKRVPRTYEKIVVNKKMTPNFIPKGSARCQNIWCDVYKKSWRKPKKMSVAAAVICLM